MQTAVLANIFIFAMLYCWTEVLLPQVYALIDIFYFTYYSHLCNGVEGIINRECHEQSESVFVIFG